MNEKRQWKFFPFWEMLLVESVIGIIVEMVENHCYHQVEEDAAEIRDDE